MHRQRLAKGAGFAHRHAAALAQGAVDGFDTIGLVFAFPAGPVLPTGQHLGVGFPPVGKYEQGRRRGNDCPCWRSGAAPRLPSVQPTLRRRARSTTGHRQALRFLWPTKLRRSSSSRISHSRCCSFFGRSRCGEAAAAFFSRLAIVIRATPATRAMLRCALRSTSRASTWAYCAALRAAAGTNRSWCRHVVHSYLG